MPHSNVTQRQRQRAKQLRAELTPAETLLWRYIRAHRIDDLGFRRQVPFKNTLPILFVTLRGSSWNSMGKAMISSSVSILMSDATDFLRLKAIAFFASRTKMCCQIWRV